MIASLLLRADGRIEDATPDAQALLGLSLDELRELPPGALSPDPPDPAAQEAFREQWESEGKPDIVGEGSLRRPDGSMIRVRFGITEQPGERFLAVLEPVPMPVTAPPTLWTGGQVLAAWRQAERSLTALEPGSPEWQAAEAEIDRLRGIYQELFRR